VFNIRVSFLSAINDVGRRVAGNERAEAALWCLMSLLRASDSEKGELACIFMAHEEIAKNDSQDQGLSG
jgi:hypothetical protein